MSVRAVTLGQLWSAFEHGPAPAGLNSESPILGFSEPKDARAQTAVFIAQAAFLQDLKIVAGAFYFVGEKLSIDSALFPSGSLFRLKDPMLAMARASKLFRTESRPPVGIHAMAAIDKTARIGKDVAIAPFASIGANAEIGEGAILHSGVSIGANVSIGAQTVLFPNVVIYDNCKLGARVRVHAGSVIGADGFGYAQNIANKTLEHVKIEHLGRVIIGDDVEVGASTSIDRGTIGNTVIGKGSKIDNQVQIAHNCCLGESVIVCGNTGMAGSVSVGDNAVVAGMVAIGNGTKVGAGAMIAGFSMVFQEVPAGAKWGGIPARPLRESMKLHALVARLPELFKAHKLEQRGNDNEV